MALQLDLPNFVRAASGVLLGLFGVALLLLRTRPTWARWTSAGLISLAPNFVMSNIIGLPLPPELVPANMALDVLAIVTFAAACHSLATEKRVARLVLALVLSVGVTTSALLASRSSWGALDVASAVTTLGSPLTMIALVLIMGLEARRMGDVARASGLVYAAAGIGAWPAVWLVVQAQPLEAWSTIELIAGSVLVLPVIATIFVLARARAGPASRDATAAAIGLALLAGSLDLLAYIALFTGIDLGAFGLARLVGLALLVTAAFRYDAFGLRLGETRAARAALAGTGLAVLFIVAQIAQNFLSAQYGLLMGGIVAGALLVAARPIERALDERREARAPAAEAAKEDAFRHAVRMALRDRTITREEELHLHRVAQHMGLPTGRAHELLVEVERELNAR